MTPYLIALAALAQADASAPPPPPPPATTTEAPTPAQMAEAAEEARFESCSSMVRVDAARAVEMANAWRVQGGGILARQCLGLAYVAQERWAEAAGVYEDAARDADRLQDSRRGDLWVQAGNAWLAGSEPTRAIHALDSALATTDLTDEMRGEVHIDRARAMVALDNAAGARTDLDRALQLVPADPLGWYLSAALARRQGDLVRARTDIGRAMELAPDNPDIVLLGGTIAGLAGDMAEAERLYRQVAEGAADTAAGRTARESLATLREIEAPAEAGTPPPASEPESGPPPQTPQSR